MLPTPITNIYSFVYSVTQDFTTSANGHATSTFTENYTFDFLDNQKLNFTASINYTFYTTSCYTPDQYNWYMDYIVDSQTRLINQTIAYPQAQNMNYINTHIRLYADGSVPVGGTMLSNNNELGYRWGIHTLKDLTLTRVADAYYSVGSLTFSALVFQGSDSQQSVIALPS